jgi:hypothetical protein
MNQHGASNDRLSAPVSARSLPPNKVQPRILDFVTQKNIIQRLNDM